MLFSSSELSLRIGQRIRERRIRLKMTQADCAARSGVAYRTWRRLETEGKASIDDLVRAALALRCEQGLEALFPEPAAQSMDQLLDIQKKGVPRSINRRARP